MGLEAIQNALQGDRDSYLQGFEDAREADESEIGYDEGFDDGTREGYREGYDEGLLDGYEDGYTAAQAEREVNPS